jgi:hypothetical protein
MSKKNAPAMMCKDAYGNSALHHAAMHGNAEVAVFLLQNGVDPAVRNNKGGSDFLLKMFIYVFSLRSFYISQ